MAERLFACVACGEGRSFVPVVVTDAEPGRQQEWLCVDCVAVLQRVRSFD
jgi:hypothetical protein